MDITIENVGDSAYNTKLFVIIPDGVTKSAVLNATDESKVKTTKELVLEGSGYKMFVTISDGVTKSVVLRKRRRVTFVDDYR